MEWLPFLLQGAALGFTAAVSPGTFQTYLVTQTLIGGWQRGSKITLAPLISDPIIILFSVLLLDRLPDGFLRAISLVGSLFVFFLAWGLFKNWRRGFTITDTKPDRRDNVLLQGALINLLSPGPYLFWFLVNGQILIKALDQSTLNGLGFLVGFYGVFIGGMLGLVALFHQASHLGEKVVRALILVCIIILVGFGLVLFSQGLGFIK